jgi:lipoprotein-anchoring transpeptidase ErfK/SrfK
MSGLKMFSLAFLASASVFAVAMAVYSDEQWAATARQTAKLAEPYVVKAGEAIDETAIRPARAWLDAETKAFFKWLAEARPKEVAAAPPKAKPAAKAVPPVPKPIIAEQKVAPVTPQDMPLADAPLPPAVDPNPPTPAELSRVVAHFRVSLTRELYDNFELFLYVSKADRGPWSQRMYVFAKERSGNISVLYTWPVSTGREAMERNHAGELLNTETPPGYYQLDPDRIYRNYHSTQWQHPMPYAMFFKWEKDGLQTGLAIHAADGKDIELLGKRSSAGCVRLAPQNAEILFRLIRKNYRGEAPRFAYDWRTDTMHNDGMMMHAADGKLKYAEGYKVLVFIENYGGENVIAALF